MITGFKKLKFLFYFAILGNIISHLLIGQRAAIQKALLTKYENYQEGHQQTKEIYDTCVLLAEFELTTISTFLILIYVYG